MNGFCFKFLKLDRIDPSEMVFTPVKFVLIQPGKNFTGQAGLKGFICRFSSGKPM